MFQYGRLHPVGGGERRRLVIKKQKEIKSYELSAAAIVCMLAGVSVGNTYGTRIHPVIADRMIFVRV